MTDCTTDLDLARFVDGALQPEHAAEIELHMAQCTTCREHRRTLETLVLDLRAPPAGALDVQAHTRAVMARLDRPSEGRRGALHPRLRVGIAGLAAAAACALALPLGWRAQRERHPFLARGGEAPASLARNVHVTPCAAGLAPMPLAAHAVIDLATPLSATYRNIGTNPAYLLLFAVDARGVVHWIAPEFTRADENPAATPLLVSRGDQVLKTTAVLDGVSPGPVRIVSVVSSLPTHVSDVESLAAAELDGRAIASHFPPGTTFEETNIDMQSASSTPDRTEGGAAR